ncbi:MAG TPA: sterol desaturase family protein [Acidimicrobiales bacterium]|nr:sterol desaturase family protein [Acidimicrobiales bacterium]
MGASYDLLVAFAACFMVAEAVLRRRRAPLDLREGRVSLTVGAIAYTLGLGSELLFTLVAASLLAHAAPWHLSAANPLVWIAFFVIDDFVNFVVHVATHKVPFLWAAHVVHHSAKDLSFVSAVRLSPVEALYQPLLVLWAPLVGVPMAVYAPMTAFALAIGGVSHTQVVGRFPRLDRWFVTPSNHRVHHGTNRQYIDKNFGSSLIVWDRVFGTYEPEVEPVRFGATTELAPGVGRTTLGGYPAWLAARRMAWRDGLPATLGASGTS